MPILRALSLWQMICTLFVRKWTFSTILPKSMAFLRTTRPITERNHLLVDHQCCHLWIFFFFFFFFFSPFLSIYIYHADSKKATTKMYLTHLISKLTLIHKNPTKSYRHYLQNTPQVVLCNRPSLSMATERLTYLNDDCGVQLGTFA